MVKLPYPPTLLPLPLATATPPRSALSGTRRFAIAAPRRRRRGALAHAMSPCVSSCAQSAARGSTVQRSVAQRGAAQCSTAQRSAARRSAQTCLTPAIFGSTLAWGSCYYHRVAHSNYIQGPTPGACCPPFLHTHAQRCQRCCRAPGPPQRAAAQRSPRRLLQRLIRVTLAIRSPRKTALSVWPALDLVAL